MKTLFLFISLIWLINPTKSQTVEELYIPRDKTYSYSWGSSKTVIRISHYGSGKKFLMLNLHADETTSIEAAKSILSQTGGILVQVDNQDERLIEFKRNGKTYKFDPNRMFSIQGIRASLKKHSRQSSEVVVRLINGFAQMIIKRISLPGITLIALHNNDNDRLSVNSFMAGGDYEIDTEEVHEGSPDPDNFVLTTDRKLFKELKNTEHHAVLQDNKKARDDGSLSIYYGRRRRSYINVEAENGAVEEQKLMLIKLAEILEIKAP